MDILTIDPTDLVILIIIFCFGLFSLFRGFTKELISVSLDFCNFCCYLLYAICFVKTPSCAAVYQFGQAIAGALIALVFTHFLGYLGRISEKAGQSQYKRC